MAKKAPFFSHDMNARYDPKMSAMRGVYGAEGYGWFWMLIEMMAEADGYQLDYKSKYVFNAYAMQLQCKPEQVSKFVSDCIDEFELFASDDSYFWSNSLRKRMQYRDSVSEKRAEAANKRWSNANASKSDANAMQKDTNKTKQNKTKHSNKKDIVDSNECDDTFEKFWSVYPQKVGKQAAKKKWKSTVYQKIQKGQVTLEHIIQGTMDYTEACKVRNREFKDGSTFVNQEAWNEDWKRALKVHELIPNQSKADRNAEQIERLKQKISGGMPIEDIERARSVIDITPDQTGLSIIRNDE